MMKNGWLHGFAPRPAARARLFCFGHAGGSAAVFRKWAELLPADVEMLAVQLPGRGGRLSEPVVDSIPALVERLLPALDYIHASTDTQVSLEALAKRVHLSPSRFQAVFRECFGLPPRDYILRQYRADYLATVRNRLEQTSAGTALVGHAQTANLDALDPATFEISD